MTAEVVEACLRFLAASDIPTLDITGGAPELHPAFRTIVRRARAMGRHVMDRCNLTITGLPNYADLPEFLASQQVEVVASLPSFAAKLTDAQHDAFKAGKLYVNVHSAANKGGEVRGQLNP